MAKTSPCLRIPLSTRDTRKAFRQTLSTLTSPTDLSGRVAYDKGVVRDIFGDHGTGTDKGIAADGYPANDRAVGSQSGAFLHQRGAELVHLADGSARVVDVGKDHRRAAKNVVFQRDALVNRHVVLDFAPFTDGHIGADNDVLPDVALFPDPGPGKDMRKMPNLGPRFDADTIVNNRRGMHEIGRAAIRAHRMNRFG